MPPAIDVIEVMRRARWHNDQEQSVKASCEGKGVYATRHQAQHVADRMNRRQTRKGKYDTKHEIPRLEPYQCRHCHEWHVGPMLSPETRQARARGRF